MKRQKPNVTDLMKMIDHLDHSVEDLHDLISNLTIEYKAKLKPLKVLLRAAVAKRRAIERETTLHKETKALRAKIRRKR